jgi:SAM-dependent methyltransferase
MNDVIGAKTLEVMEGAPAYNNWILEIIRPHLRGKVVELGAGIGTFAKKIADLGFDVTALDYNAEYLKKIKTSHPQIHTQLFDAQVAKLPQNLKSKFDTLITLNVLEHLKDDDMAVDNINKMLNENGQLLALVPAFKQAYSGLDKNLGHFRRYDKNGFISLLTRNGFEIQEVRYINPLGLLGWYIAGKIFGQSALKKSQIGLFDILVRPILFLEKHIRFSFGISLFVVARKK